MRHIRNPFGWCWRKSKEELWISNRAHPIYFIQGLLFIQNHFNSSKILMLEMNITFKNIWLQFFHFILHLFRIRKTEIFLLPTMTNPAYISCTTTTKLIGGMGSHSVDPPYDPFDDWKGVLGKLKLSLIQKSLMINVPWISLEMYSI